MSRILVFTGSTGGGHTQVAKTLQKELESRGHEVIISDLLNDFSRIIKFICVDTYRFLYKRIPVLYGVTYRWSNHKIISNVATTVFNALIGRKLIKYISELEVDIVVSVHPFGSGVLGKLRKNKKIECNTIALITDFKAHWMHVGKECRSRWSPYH